MGETGWVCNSLGFWFDYLIQSAKSFPILSAPCKSILPHHSVHSFRLTSVMEGQYFAEDIVSRSQLDGNHGADGATTLDSLARGTNNNTHPTPPENPPATDRQTALPATFESDSLLFFLMHLACDKIDRTLFEPATSHLGIWCPP